MNIFEKRVWNESKFDTDTPVHIEVRDCGIFVVGLGSCISCNDYVDAQLKYYKLTGRVFFI